MAVAMKSLLAWWLVAQAHGRDYEYSEQFDAYYKYYDEVESFGVAFRTCYDRGAELFAPDSAAEADFVVGLAKSRFWIGVRLIGDRFRAANVMRDVDCAWLPGNSSHATMTTSGQCQPTDEWTNHGFVCKGKNAKENIRCDYFGYTYIEMLGGCYRRQYAASDWFGAVETCRSDGAALMVPETLAEATHFRNVLNNDGEVFVGIMDLLMPGCLFSIHGQRLDHLEFKYFGHGKQSPDLNKNCVTFSGSTELRRVDCKATYGFICEMIPKNEM